ncbi:hypothetical protein BCR37DRAFT_384261 [Protomyces lactucae-debilis]|uniref:N-terminal of MaoC-like dehydratase domain-containing protein n=1 Tax=Protomyces lactucae-debilis TaxID=2754530 RepID=A0A1Y2ETF2_PROLT|nr:uncharacterized protein BCR37DRAFT_384261 [Protomyces lactucae-debilis]ORY74840.1 hypothetical protein BCR37DRAFT_384261 [Protomyces lactucae-debilis]
MAVIQHSMLAAASQDACGQVDASIGKSTILCVLDKLSLRLQVCLLYWTTWLTPGLDSATAKITKSGQPMIVVTAKKEYHNESGLALTERRQWLFREASELSNSASPAKPSIKEAAAGVPIGELTASEVLLFRFSALTFNAHRIHYDKEHTIHKEGHPEVVVHAPLNVLLLANAFRHHSKTSTELTGMHYRAQSPVYARQPYSVLLDGNTIRAVHQDSQKVIMSASMQQSG